jgi:hypothetical protein
MTSRTPTVRHCSTAAPSSEDSDAATLNWDKLDELRRLSVVKSSCLREISTWHFSADGQPQPSYGMLQQWFRA